MGPSTKGKLHKVVQQLIREIQPYVRQPGDVPILIQVLSMLNFFAKGEYQM